MSALHPASRLLFWLGFVLFIQGLTGLSLLAAFLPPLLCGPCVLVRGGKLVWRARWLLLSLLLILAWSIPGEPLWLSAHAPTQEGVQAALTQLARLLLVLLAVAALMESMTQPELLMAAHVLAWPLRRMGVDVDRALVRLILTLRYVETLPHPRDWRTLLAEAEALPAEIIDLWQVPFGRADLLAAALFLLVFGI